MEETNDEARSERLPEDRHRVDGRVPSHQLELWHQYRAGGDKSASAKDELAKSLYPLVSKICYKIARKYRVDPEETLGAAQVHGMLKALDSYTASMKCSIATYVGKAVSNVA